MKKTLMFPALVLAITGSVTGCCANSGSCCGDECAEVVEVESVEVIPGTNCTTKGKSKTAPAQDKKCRDVKGGKTTSCNESTQEQKGQDSTSCTKTADCGGCSKDENKEAGSQTGKISAIF